MNQNGHFAELSANSYPPLPNDVLQQIADLSIQDGSTEKKEDFICNGEKEDLISNGDKEDLISGDKDNLICNEEITTADGGNMGALPFIEQSVPTLRKGFARMPVAAESPIYNMSHAHRGYCLLFNHHYFDRCTRLNARKGTMNDRNAIKILFEQLGFQVVVFDDLTVKEIGDQLFKYASDVDHTDCDCLVVFFLTHGEDGQLYGRDNLFSVDKLFSGFTGDNCPSLAGKPKMFFIQACRGEGVDNPVVLVDTRDEIDSGTLKSYKIPTQCDFLICYSTVNDYYSWRNTSNGAWFIQSLVSVFEKEYTHEDVLSMMVTVNRTMILFFESNCPSQREMHGKKQTASICSTLMRKIYFAPQP